MSLDTDSLAARDLTLQKIGRNVVNFQKMEAMLKFILAAANFSIPLSKVSEHIGTTTKRTRRTSMGVLVEGAAKALHSEAPSSPPDINEIWITHTVSLSGGETQSIVWRREMRKVVRERNALIHKMLLHWDPTSIDGCRDLCDELANTTGALQRG